MKTLKHPISKELYRKELRAHHRLYRTGNMIEELQDYIIPKSIDWKIPTGIITSGDVTSGTTTTLTDTTATWIPNAYTDKICKIYKNGGTDYMFDIIQSNTADTLTFDDELLAVPCNQCSYEIIHSLVLEENDPSVIVAVDARHGKGGVILPKSSPLNERLWVHVYLERGDIYLDSPVPIIARNTDRIGGAKYGTIEQRNEGVRLYAHQWISSHWDIISTYNITRIGSAYWTDEVQVVPNNTFEYVTPNSIITTDISRRFLPHDLDGNIWWRYTSLLPKYFTLKFSANIDKTGGVGDIEIIWRIRYANGVMEDLDIRRAQTRFGSGVGEDNISISVPIQLFRNDEVTPVAAKSGGTFFIDQGSSILISEL